MAWTTEQLTALEMAGRKIRDLHETSPAPEIVAGLEELRTGTAETLGETHALAVNSAARLLTLLDRRHYARTIEGLQEVAAALGNTTDMYEGTDKVYQRYAIAIQ